MNVHMAFECLLVSHDPDVCRTTREILKDLSISSDHCPSASKASEVLSNGSHDLVIIDWTGSDSLDLVREIRRMKRKLTVMAISSESSTGPGVHVMLPKPITPESAKATFRVAYSRMLLDHRLRARYPVMIALVATNEDQRSIAVTVTDIGDGGVGLSSKEILVIGDVLSFTLQLRGSKRPIRIQARVLWTREYGAAGCEFLRIPPVDLGILHDWLDQHIRVKKPLISL